MSMITITVFNSEQFGDIRTVTIDGEPWFVGKDVAESLGYSNSRDALAKHVDEEDKGESQIATPSGVQTMVIINESGLYSLILGSNLPKAKEFKHWITSEVLPSIRKTGGYQISGPASSLTAISIQHATEIKKNLEELIGLKPGIAAATAISMVEADNNVNLDELKRLLPAADYNVGLYNATQLASMVGLKKAQDVNLRLAALGLQVRKENGNGWEPTEEGKKYGEYFPYKNKYNGHTDFQWRWNSDVIEPLENYVDEE